MAAFFERETRPRGEARLIADILELTVDHLWLVFVSLGAAVLLGIPLGILAARHRELGQMELAAVGVLQTIPSLALLCFMIPLFGIGKLPALVALSLYALLPIVRNTYTGLIGIDRQLLEIAGVLGLSPAQRLVRIELPLASLHILSGIKTSAIWTVGTATLAAFIGGGGYGDLIVRGLALDDTALILAGAVPSAADGPRLPRPLRAPRPLAHSPRAPEDALDERVVDRPPARRWVGCPGMTRDDVDVEAYLERIGARAPLAPSAEALADLQQAHVGADPLREPRHPPRTTRSSSTSRACRPSSSAPAGEATASSRTPSSRRPSRRWAST